MEQKLNLGIADGKYGDLTIKDGVVSKGRNVVVQPFGSTLLVDVTARQSKQVETQSLLDRILAAAGGLGLEIRYVSGLKSFFDPKARWSEFLKSGDAAGVELSDAEREAVKTYDALKQRFETIFTLPVPPKPEYVPVAVPAKVTDPLSRFTINKRRISTKSGNYSISMTRAKRVWNEAREFWRSGKTRGYLKWGSYGGYNRTPSISNKGLTIGCQRFNRWEVEALAKHFGWEF